MDKRILRLMFAACAMLAACSCRAPTVAPGVAVERSGTMRLSVLGAASVADVPSLMALEALEKQGYQTEAIHFAKSSLILPALLNGDLELSAANSTLVGAAIQEGAGVGVIVGKVRVRYVLAARAGIEHCRDLDGKSVVFSTRQSVGYVMFEQFVQRHCPGMTPEIVLISGSENRVVALQTEEVDAAYLGIDEWKQLQETAPGRFGLLIDFPSEFPEIQLSMYSVRREWAKENPQMVKDFVGALLEANRSVLQDRQLLVDAIVKYVEVEPDMAENLAQEYLSSQFWDPNGQITAGNIQATLDFLRAGDMLSSDLTVEQFADLSYLNAVLDEIGRQ
jgi:ABC-type nitrate/sulfonate/bicarbonate transport system substrate-binding protein